MKVGDLRRGDSQPSLEQYLKNAIICARKSFPNAPSDDVAMALTISSLKRNLEFRTKERDRYAQACHAAGINIYAK